MINANSTGFDEVYRRLTQQIRNNDEVMKKVVQEGAEILERELQSKTPVSKGEDADGIHAKDHIVHTPPSVLQGILTSQVGFDDKVAWRIKFVEFGTIHQQPQGFMGKISEDPNVKKKLQKNAIKVIQRELRL